ncbi:carboxypeptidase-like regulatory domain-containing protein [Pontibacter silvestris]|uniref:Carboxypeptidase-like regulatory domain-containing protein n=1 Tax=Pontibacter silvestris TaxID=2305183 RepID=A0ABW4WWX3_9BACT|nr:carboxypeptidase-like regulatory domain-containing protein [Pontibacter silvestris]MCC9136806.1 carboxypeptidase-like regulatory domain-containing protein [Pontibacter silvestris]
MKALVQNYIIDKIKGKWLLLPVLATLLLLVATPQEAAAQGQKRVVQLSGFVTAGDSLYGLVGVTIYVPGSTRGTQSNQYGFFSLPVVTGDSVLFGALGYRRQYLKIPNNYSSQSYSIIMQMQQDPNELPTVDVFPWPTERDFREAVANLKLPDEGRAIATRNLDPERLEELFKTTPMSESGNFRFWQQQQQIQTERRYMYPTFSPFAIPTLINSIFGGNKDK